LIREWAEDAVADLGAAALEENGVGNGCREVILELDGVFGRERGGERRKDGGDTTVEQESLVLWAGLGVDSEGGGVSLARGEVMIGGAVGGEIGGSGRFDLYGTPGDGAFGVFLLEGDVAAGIQSRDVGVGIPLGDQTLGEGDVHGHGRFLRGIEIQNGSFHADGAAKAAFEIGVLEMLDERREIGGTREREPVHRQAVRSSDGGEGAPFVRGDVVGVRGDEAGEENEAENDDGCEVVEFHSVLLRAMCVRKEDAPRGRPVNEVASGGKEAGKPYKVKGEK